MDDQTPSGDSLPVAVPLEHRTFVGWITLRLSDPASLAGSRALLRHLQNPQDAWRQLAVRFSSTLVQMLSCAAGLRKKYLAQPPEAASSLLRQWSAWASVILPHWPPVNSAGWDHLVLDETKTKNGLVIAAVSASLQEAARGANVSAELKAVAEQFQAADGAWCRSLPLPPSPGRSLCPEDYLHSAEDAELAATCTHMAGMALTANSQLRRANGYHAEGRAALASVMQRKMLVAQLTDTNREVIDLVRYFGEGWPVEASRLATLLEAGATKMEGLLGLPPTDRESLHAPDLPAALDAFRRTAAVLERVCADRTPTQAAKAGSEFPREAGAQPTGRLLQALATRLGAVKQDGVRPIAERLADIAARIDPVASPGASRLSDEELPRHLLQCLMMIDDLAGECNPGEAVSTAREQLRQVLFDRPEGSPYTLLDRELVGKSIHDCADAIEVSRLVPHASLPSHAIADVYRPGYAFGQQGRQTVLRKAKVAVVR